MRSLRFCLFEMRFRFQEIFFEMNRSLARLYFFKDWVPAFAGMTNKGICRHIPAFACRKEFARQLSGGTC